MIKYLWILVILTLPNWCLAGDIKGERKVQANKLIELESSILPSKDKDGKETTKYSWKVAARDGNGKDIEISSRKYGHYFIATAPAGSTIRVDLTVLDWDARVFDESSAIVVVEGDKPKPPPPPDEPVVPDDPLFAGFKQAYDSDTTSGKALKLQKLAAVYKVASEQTGNWKLAKEMFEDVSTARKAQGIGDDELLALRKLLATELGKFLPSNADEELSTDHKQRTKNFFLRVSGLFNAIASKGGK